MSAGMSVWTGDSRVHSAGPLVARWTLLPTVVGSTINAAVIGWSPPVRVHSARGVCIGEPKESMTLYCDGRKCVYVSVDGEPGRWCMDGEPGWNDYVSSVVCTVLT